MRQWTKIGVIAAIAAVAAVLIYLWQQAASQRRDPSRSAPTYTYRITNAYPHDPDAFTQGLVFEGSFLYEGTGLRGRSSLRKVELETGEVLMVHELEDRFFGEGITIHNDRIIQLTYESKTGFIYDMATLAPLKEFTYSTYGWGITSDGANLILSDGTSMLHLLDPVTFQRTGQIIVKDGNIPVIRLNELEYVQGEIYANVWLTDFIARISPRTGRVTGWIDLSGLLAPEDSRENVDVLNGIAYDKANDRLFVTGKLWPKVFEIEVVR